MNTNLNNILANDEKEDFLQIRHMTRLQIIRVIKRFECQVLRCLMAVLSLCPYFLTSLRYEIELASVNQGCETMQQSAHTCITNHFRNLLESLSDESALSDLYTSGWVDGNNADVYDYQTDPISDCELLICRQPLIPSFHPKFDLVIYRWGQKRSQVFFMTPSA